MTAMKLTALFAFAALALAGAPASAQAVMLNFSFAEMRQQLTDQGVTITKEADTEEKTHYIQGKDENGLIFAVYGMECDSETPTPTMRCTGAEMIASFTLADKSKINEALDMIDYAAVSDYKGTDGNVKISRYVIFDNGITPANLKVNIEVFLDLANNVWDALDDEDLLGK
jgi:hypothetical protein